MNMWARIVEIILGIWLLSSVGIFANADAVIDIACGIAVVALAALSLSKRFNRAHLIILPIAAWLIIWGYISGYPAPPHAQSQIIVGILLGMFAIIPTRSGEIPDSWQRFYTGDN